MIVSFEREVEYPRDEDGEPLPPRETTIILCDVDLDHGCSIRLTSDEPEGDRQWRILEFEVGYVTYDVRESVFSRRSTLGPEPVLPESELLRAVRAEFAAWVARERPIVK